MVSADPEGPARGAAAAAARRGRSRAQEEEGANPNPSPAAAAAANGPEADGGKPGGEPRGPANGEAGRPLETCPAAGSGGAPKDEVARGEAPAVESESVSRGVNGAAAPRPSPASEPSRGAPPPPPAIPATSLALNKSPFSPLPREAWVPSWSRGRAPKASARELGSWVALLLTLDGRDKATKVLQYACRTLSWWLLSLATASSPSSFSWTRLPALGGPERQAAARQACLNHSLRFAELKAALTQGRKAFRLGRTLIELHRLFELLSAGSELSFSAASLRRQLGGLLGLSPCRREEEEEKSRACSIGPPPAPSPPAPRIDTVCAAVKLLGLAGFWAADNASYLAQCGLFDDYRRHATAERRGKARARRASQFSSWANRSYFVGALAGLAASLRACARHRSTTIVPLLLEGAADTAKTKATDPSDESGGADDPRDADRGALLDRALEKQFGNLVALAKSCCDVLVFSNNPGVDLWKRSRRGAPMHEGFHCLCGLVSASAVLYNNFPNSNCGGSAGPAKK